MIGLEKKIRKTENVYYHHSRLSLIDLTMMKRIKDFSDEEQAFVKDV